MKAFKAHLPIDIGKYVWFICIYLFVTASAVAQCWQINGATSVSQNQTYTYTFCRNDSAMVNPAWKITNGTLLSSSLSTDHLTISASIRWDEGGIGYIKLQDGKHFATSAKVFVQCSSTIPGVPTIATPTAVCAGSAATLSASLGTNGDAIKWFTKIDEAAVATSATYQTGIQSAVTVYYAATYNSTAHCYSNLVSIPTKVVPPPQATKSNVIYGSGSAIIQVNPVGDSYSSNPHLNWYDAETGGTLLQTSGSSYTTPVLTTSKTYYVSTVSPVYNCETPRIPVNVTVLPAGTSPSKLRLDVVRTAGITDVSQVYTLPADQKLTTFTYYDGLSRVSQQVVLQASPSGKDVVTPVEYDANGRTTKAYLPYVSPSSDGTFKSYKTEQPAFYLADNDKIANDSSAYSLSVVEASPLGRVLEQGSVGKHYQPGTGKTTTITYSTNTGAATEAEEVRMLRSDGSSTQFYAANALTRTESTSPDGNKVIEFRDKLGRLIAAKQLVNEVINGVTVTYLQTYYVYDDFDRIKYIIPPKGVVALKKNNWVLSSLILSSYVHQFVYDNKGRLVEKKAPGQDWLYSVYDKLDRLVLQQDATLRGQKQWQFFKYDRKGRLVMQGIYQDLTHLTRPVIQSYIDASIYTAANADYQVDSWFESRGSVHGYTNTSFPKFNYDKTAFTVTQLSYYDDYDFDFDNVADYSYVSQGMAGEGTQGRSFGLPTGSKTLVLGSTTWLYNYIFYDKYGRVIQSRSNNHLSTTPDNLVTAVYDFEGKTLAVKKYHNAGAGKTTTVLNKYSYDNQGRVTKVFQNNNGAPSDQLVAQYTYNELGQVVDKNLHNTSGNAFLQSVDFRYSIQGQLLSVNNAQLTSDNGVTNDDTNDYFGLELLYEQADAGLGNIPAFNGNITAVKWKAPGISAGANDQHAYVYTYDKSNKLKTAVSKSYKGTAWNSEVGVHDENVTFDLNGNVATLKRYQRKYTVTNNTTVSYVSDNIDNLTYTYSSSIGDQLLKVEDAATSTGGFTNGANVATEYTYNANGSILTDQNKKINNVVYNTLGKPATILFTDNRRIDYIYDAAGNKLTMKTYAVGGALTLTTDYVDGFVYENNVLSFFSSPEGRVVKNGANLEYQYALTDHQGNVRVLFTSAAAVVQKVTATFEPGAQATEAGKFTNYPATSGINPVATNNTTAGGTSSQYLNGGYKGQVGVSNSYKVYPGDIVKIEANARYDAPSSTSGNLVNFAAALLGAFNLQAPVAGETGTASAALNSWGALEAGGFGDGSSGNGLPKAFVNIIIFDKNYNFLDVAYAQVNSSGAPSLISASYTIKEEGYAFLYVSNEHPTLTDVYYDDVTTTYTPTSVIQYNEYYPFGLQTDRSWTRGNAKNNFLYNQGSEMISATGWYDTPFRNYDPVLARFHQVDPLAYADHFTSPYAYGSNNPVLFNDPTGLFTSLADLLKWQPIRDLWDTQYGGTYTNGKMTEFKTSAEAFQAGVDYNDRHNAWGNVPGGARNFNEASANYYAKTKENILYAVTIRENVYQGQIISYGGEPYYNSKWLHERLDHKTLDRDKIFSQKTDELQDFLDNVGLIPGAGEIADGLNAVIHLARGNVAKAGLSTAAMIPIVGWLASGSKIGRKIWTSKKAGSAVENAFQHWQKHGSEFPNLQNSKQYVEAAHNFLHASPAGTLTKLRPNGDILKYDPATNIFGVMDQFGSPRTMFKPTNGINYWNAQ